MDILVVRHDMHGDVLCVTSILPGLKRKYPGCNIDFLTNPGYEQVLLNNPHIRGVVRVAEERLYDLRMDIDHAVRWDGWMPACHCRQADVEFSPPQLFLGDDETVAAEVDTERTIAVSASAGWPGRRYAFMEGAVTVLKTVYPGLNFIQIDTGPSLGIERVKMTVREAIVFLSKCCLYLGVDSLFMHAAAALNIPMVLVMGITGPEIQYVPNATIVRDGPYTSWGDPKKQGPIAINPIRVLRAFQTRACGFEPTSEFEYTDQLGYLI